MAIPQQIQNLVDRDELSIEQAIYLNKILGNFVKQAFWYIDHQDEKYQLDPTDFWFISKPAITLLLSECNMKLVKHPSFPFSAREVVSHLTESGYEALQSREVVKKLFNGEIKTIQELNDFLSEEDEYDCSIPDEYICPITHAIMKDPAFDTKQAGTSVPRFERTALVHYLGSLEAKELVPENPLTREPFVGRGIQIDHKLRAEIEEFKAAHRITRAR